MSLDDWLKVCQILGYVILFVFGITWTTFFVFRCLYEVKMLKQKYLKEKEPDEWVEEE